MRGRGWSSVRHCRDTHHADTPDNDRTAIINDRPKTVNRIYNAGNNGAIYTGDQHGSTYDNGHDKAPCNDNETTADRSFATSGSDHRPRE